MHVQNHGVLLFLVVVFNISAMLLFFNALLPFILYYQAVSNSKLSLKYDIYTHVCTKCT